MIDLGTKIADEVSDLIRDARLIELQPDDILVLESPHVISADHAQRIKQLMAEYTDHRVIVIGNDAHLVVLRHTA